MRVGRNDLCPCGSGKKYKKCCMNNKVVSLDGAIDKELNQLQEPLLYFFEKTSHDEAIEIVADSLENSTYSEDEEQFLTLILLMGVIFREPLTSLSNSTLAEAFVQEKVRENKLRPSVLTQLKKWQNVQPSFTKLLTKKSDLHIEVEDLFTKEVKQVKLDEPQSQLEKGSILFGFLLPYGGYYRFFFHHLDLNAEEVAYFAEDIFLAFEKSAYEDATFFVTNELPDIVKLMILGEDHFDVVELEWGNPLHEMVANLYEKKVDLLNDYMPDLKETGTIMWNVFCAKENPTFRKPQVYAAALHYFIDSNIPGLGYYTQKELAEIYGVSVASLSKAYRKMEDGLAEELDEMEEKMGEMVYDLEDEMDIGDDSFPFNPMEMEKSMREITRALEEKDFDSEEEMNDYINQLLNGSDTGPQRELSVEEQAEELIYEAVNAGSGKRVRLAIKALELDPFCADAFTILGEEAPGADQSLNYFAEGMEVGEQKLGKQYFQENEGRFWGLIETRPYMRARFNYALQLADNGEKAESIKHYERLLELNDNDNQGVRDNLFAAYLELGEYQKAKELLEAFPDDITARGTYNAVLLEYHTNGFSAKLDKLLKHAKETNPYVIDYLVKKRRLPVTAPMGFQLGGEEEAEIYVMDTMALWNEDKALMDWLKK